jgi:hypothetical protein
MTWRSRETAECIFGRVGRGIPGEVCIRLYESARRYPEVIGLTCITSVYHARTDVLKWEEDARSSVLWCNHVGHVLVHLYKEKAEE